MRLAGASGISIHAPHTGRDSAVEWMQSIKILFQSTRPIRGATNVIGVPMASIRFQSTRPIRGATILCFAGECAICYFNPRAPYGARQDEKQRTAHQAEFQSTLPIRGTT